ncbi:TRAP transporter small permease [Anaerotalea alkaliphila]|uniref:TRAP transporter small permease n=1 Tax=Anaerotalea alkaliphila TaxID=2662126 RepID=A0A7X5HXL7_9FIRM|nr:TRAP transporter small permease [Anaerotalea alkaliphila]NDL68544.1 TRAP transporter small permease [Anaerotalea alkaliphila]
MFNLLNNEEVEGKSRVYRLTNALCCIFVIIQVAVVSIVVIGRYVFNSTPSWGEELALLCMIWFSLLTVSLAITDSRHLKMTLAEMYMPRKFNLFVAGINYIVFLSLAVFMIVEGTRLTALTVGSVLPGLKISGAYLYASVPVSGVAMLASIIGKMIKREAI